MQIKTINTQKHTHLTSLMCHESSLCSEIFHSFVMLFWLWHEGIVKEISGAPKAMLTKIFT